MITVLFIIIISTMLWYVFKPKSNTKKINNKPIFMPEIQKISSPSINLGIQHNPYYVKNKSTNYLLSLFVECRTLDEWHLSSARWGNKLSQPVEEVLKKMIIDGIIVPCDTIDKMEFLTVGELKSILKENNLPTSGVKAKLIERVVTYDISLVEPLVGCIDAYKCSKIYLEDAVDFINEQKKIKNEAESLCYDALYSSNMKKAIEITGEYNRSLVFTERGLGFDWKDFPSKQDKLILKYIFSLNPSILSTIKKDELIDFRVAAAIKYLWGKYNKKILPTNQKFEVDECVLMILNAAHNKCRLDEFRELPLKHTYNVVAVNDGCSCEYCLSFASRTFNSIDELPELPLEGCTCKRGCRCYYRCN